MGQKQININGRVIRAIFPGRIDFYRMCLVLAAVLVEFSRVSGEDNAKESQRELRGRLVTEITDVSISSEHRVMLFNRVVTLDEPDREGALVEILTKGDEQVARPAARLLIKERKSARNHSRVITSRFHTWSPASQYGMLDEIAWAGVVEEFIDIPRDILRAYLAHREPPEVFGELPRTLADAAALVLAKYQYPEDVLLFERLVDKHPTIYGAWLALARIGTLSDDVKAIAREVFVDESYPRHVRLAAAVALAPDHKDAEEFAIDIIQKYLQEFSDLDLAKLLIHVAAGTPREKIKGHEHFPRYERDLMLVSMLLFMDTKSAGELTLRYLHAKDMHIRKILGLIAVLRWPDKFLEVDQGSLPEYEPGEYDRLLGFLVRERPALKERAIAVSSQERVERAVATARPVAAFTMAGKGGFLFIGW